MWKGIDEPRLAVKVNAIVGGTPAYRREFIRNDVPAGADDFDAWVIRPALAEDDGILLVSQEDLFS